MTRQYILKRMKQLNLQNSTVKKTTDQRNITRVHVTDHLNQLNQSESSNMKDSSNQLRGENLTFLLRKLTINSAKNLVATVRSACIKNNTIFFLIS